MKNIFKNPLLILLTSCFFIIFLGGCDSYLAPSNKVFIISILSAIIFFIALVRTDFALGILIFSMLLSPEFKLGSIPGREIVLRFDDILLVSVFLGWLAKMAVNKEFSLMRSTPLNKPIIAYIGVCIIATLLAAMQGLVKIKVSAFYLLKYFEYFLLFFMVSNNLRGIEQAKRFVRLMFIVAAIVSVYAITQIGTGARVTAPFEGGAGGEANTLGGYLTLLMSLALGLLLCSRTFNKKLLFTGLLVLMGIPFLYTLSRGAWLAFIAMFIIFIVLDVKARPFLLGVLVIFVIFSSVIFPKRVQERVKETFTPYRTYTSFGKTYSLDESTSIRIESWKEAFKEFQKRPIFGRGVPAAQVIDNQYARIIRETGLIGIASFIWLLIMILRVSWRAYKKCKEDWFTTGLSLGYLCGFIGLLVHSLSAETFILIRIMEPFWFLTAIIVMLPNLRNVSIQLCDSKK